MLLFILLPPVLFSRLVIFTISVILVTDIRRFSTALLMRLPGSYLDRPS